MSSDFNCSATGKLLSPEAKDFSFGRWQLCTALSVILMVAAVLFVGIFYWGKKIAKFERLRPRRMTLAYLGGAMLILYAQVG